MTMIASFNQPLLCKLDPRTSTTSDQVILPIIYPFSAASKSGPVLLLSLVIVLPSQRVPLSEVAVLLGCFTAGMRFVFICFIFGLRWFLDLFLPSLELDALMHLIHSSDWLGGWHAESCERSVLSGCTIGDRPVYVLIEAFVGLTKSFSVFRCPWHCTLWLYTWCLELMKQHLRRYMLTLSDVSFLKKSRD